MTTQYLVPGLYPGGGVVEATGVAASTGFVRTLSFLFSTSNIDFFPTGGKRGNVINGSLRSLRTRRRFLEGAVETAVAANSFVGTGCGCGRRIESDGGGRNSTKETRNGRWRTCCYWRGAQHGLCLHDLLGSLLSMVLGGGFPRAFFS